MILATITATVAAEKRDELVQAVRAILPRVQQEPGCVACRLCQDVSDPGTFVLAVSWKSRQDLENHLGSGGFEALRAAFTIAPAPPAVRFDMVSRTHGIELAEAVARARLAGPAAAGSPAGRSARAGGGDPRRRGLRWVFGPVLDGRTGYGMRWK